CVTVVTVKLAALLETPLTVTVTACAPAPTFGTVVTICEALHDVTVAVVVPKRTVLEPWVVPKLLPLRVTAVPTVPLEGLTPLIEGVLPAWWFSEALPEMYCTRLENHCPCEPGVELWISAAVLSVPNSPMNSGAVPLL